MDKQWFNKSIEEVKEQLKVGNQGLSNEQVKEKREIYGLNELQAQKKKSLIVKFLEQFKDFMIIVLITLFLKRFLIDKVIHFQSESG